MLDFESMMCSLAERMNLPRVEGCGYMFDKSIPFSEEKGDSHRGQAAQLPEARQGGGGLAE